MKKIIRPERRNILDENTNDISSVFHKRSQELFGIKSAGEVLYNSCVKYYPDGGGGFYPVKRIVFDRPIYNPERYEVYRGTPSFEDLVQTEEKTTNIRNSEPAFWKKSFNRARQQCFDYLMCNPDIDTFLTFTVDPKRYDSFDYGQIVSSLSTWLDNRVRRKGLKYILVPERHKSGAIHFHGLSNFEPLKLIESGYFRHRNKYTLPLDEIPARERAAAQTIYNVKDLPLGFSTAIRMEGENAHEKVAKYIWKYMTKQDGQKLGGRFYLHGGQMVEPLYVYENADFSEAEGDVVSYAKWTSCKIETFFS